jgi:hypothetical protein
MTAPRGSAPPASPSSAAPRGGDAFSSGSITTVLDAPALDRATPGLPRMFRSCLEPPKRDLQLPSLKGLQEIRASGSAQYSRHELEAVLASGFVQQPVTVVDLRQESHGFVYLSEPLNGETTNAVGWYAERDWINVGKGLPSIELDERLRLAAAAQSRPLVVTWILTKTLEDGIATAESVAVFPKSFATEREVVEGLGQSYLRLPTTDHLRPRDAEVDAFVRIHLQLPADGWMHFHCRGGDGRTTTFMVMRDVMRNAPLVGIDDIVKRQFMIGGANLDKLPDPTSFAYPFAIERSRFVRDFYDYVCAAMPSYALTWSDWIAGR